MTPSRASLDLPDGRAIEFEIRRSPRARAVYFRVCPREGLVVTVPRRMGQETIRKMVAGKAAWVARHLSRFEALRPLIDSAAVRPDCFDLPALDESWQVGYRTAHFAGARTHDAGRIVVSGPVDDVHSCHSALRRWLARRAASALSPWLSGLAQHTGLRYADLSIRNQRGRWGSCTAAGRISLNCKLLFLPRELVSYVMVHELCHLLEANHSHRFWAHVRRLEPASDTLRRRMRDAWALVPAWAG